MLLDWARKVVTDCTAASVEVFVKHLGARPVEERKPLNCRAVRKTGTGEFYAVLDLHLELKDRNGGDTAEWPEALRVRQFPIAGRPPV